MSNSNQDTIAAIATAPGKGGIGIVRLSGPLALSIAGEVCQKPLVANRACFRKFSFDQTQIDEGIAIYFPGPHSFTGEDVVELQAHGGPVILKVLTEACISLGARAARAGEFSERAFLNDRMDLTQAEAIADLINAGTKAAARAAVRSLDGEFSKHINKLQLQLTELRVFVEAAIDFPEEEIDFLLDDELQARVADLENLLSTTIRDAKRGAMINEGAKIAIVGRPNAGKSSLINRLTQRDVAIVTEIAGTTRDSIEQRIEIGGAPITLVDTAGLNDSPDQVEKLGIDRSKLHAEESDMLLVLFDSHASKLESPEQLLGQYAKIISTDKPTLYVANKIDLSGLKPGVQKESSNVIGVSANTGSGIDALFQSIENQLDLGSGEPAFSARSRHIISLKRASGALQEAVSNFKAQNSGELFAEDLRAVQLTLSEITGNLSADDLLGEIFSGFCIGK